MPRSVDSGVFMLPNGQSISTGLTIVAGEDGSPPTERRVRWVRSDNGALVADIYAFRDEAFHQNNAYFRTVTRATESANTILTATSEANSSVGALLVTSYSEAANSSSVQAQAVDGFGSVTNLIIDGQSRSSYMQLADGAAVAKIKYGRAVIAVPIAAGAQYYNINLPAAFPNNLLAFLCSGYTVSINFANTQFYGTDVVSPGVGKVALVNPTVAQNFTFNYIAIGN